MAGGEDVPVAVDGGVVDLAVGGLAPGPLDRQAEGVAAHGRDPVEVLLVPVPEVDGDPRRLDPALGLPVQPVVGRLARAVLAALDLEAARGDPEAEVLGQDRASLMSRTGPGLGQGVEDGEVPRGPDGEVDLVGAGIHEGPDLVDHLVGRSHQAAGPGVLGHATELGPEAARSSAAAPTLTAQRISPGSRSTARAVLGQHVPLVGEDLGGDEGDVPAVGVPGGDGQGPLLAAAADPDGQLGLHRLGVAAASVSVKCSPAKSVRSSRSSPRMHWTASSRMSRRSPVAGERDAVGVVLADRPPGAETELGPAARTGGRWW